MSAQQEQDGCTLALEYRAAAHYPAQPEPAGCHSHIHSLAEQAGYSPAEHGYKWAAQPDDC
jgi:hypothetical protein